MPSQPADPTPVSLSRQSYPLRLDALAEIVQRELPLPTDAWGEEALLIAPAPEQPSGKTGAVYTRPWVVELILDLAGYHAEHNLVDAVAVEPAAGEGAFLAPIIRRLVTSCRRQNRPLADCARALLIYEIDDIAAQAARETTAMTLRELEAPAPEARWLAARWVQVGDYLLAAPSLPRADFVIGNPPYIRLEDLDRHRGAVYRAAYPTMKGRADIYVAFYEASLRQLKPGGICAFICADRWMLNHYGADLRRLVTAGYSVDTVLEMHTAAVFESGVSAYPAITIIRRGEQGPAVVANAGPSAAITGPHRLARSLEDVRSRGNDGGGRCDGVTATRVETWFTGSHPWLLVAPERLALLQRLEQEFYPLESEGSATRVGIGVASGLDAVFITKDPAIVEQSRLLPLAMASDLVDGSLVWSGHYLVNPWDDHGLVNLARFPRLAAFFEQYRGPLQKRHIGRQRPDQWYRTIDRVNHSLGRAAKLYIPDIMHQLDPVIDEGQTYPHHNLYVVQSAGWDLEVLGGLLLSAVGQFFVECYGVRIRGGYFRFQAQYLRRIRVPRPGDIPPAQALALATAFRTRDRALATRVASDIYRIQHLPMETRGGP